MVGKLPGLTQLLVEDSRGKSHRNSSALRDGERILCVRNSILKVHMGLEKRERERLRTQALESSPSDYLHKKADVHNVPQILQLPP